MFDCDAIDGRPAWNQLPEQCSRHVLYSIYFIAPHNDDRIHKNSRMIDYGRVQFDPLAMYFVRWKDDMPTQWLDSSREWTMFGHSIIVRP